MFEQISVWPRLMSPRIHRLTTTSSPALPALVAVTAVWGLTFVQVKDAVEVYPVMPFLALRFAIAALVLAPFAAGRSAARPARARVGAIAGALLAGGYTPDARSGARAS
jgi:drug/metabolite transporter (DMT)-like permease